jgi:hypothetical protein
LAGCIDGVGMVVTEHMAAAAGQAILVASARLLILAQFAQVGRESADCGEGVGVVVAEKALGGG